MGGEEFKWHQPVHYQLWSQQRPHFSPHSTAKNNDEGMVVSIGISDVVIASVHSDDDTDDDDYYYYE